MAMTGRSAALECRGLHLAYDGQPVVTGVALDVLPGESIVLLGPSGSGKTTILSAIAGFIDPIGGEILLGGRTVATAERSVPPEQRRIGVVFQHYALWPHLTAVQTVAYPMHRQGMARSQARAEALVLLERLGLADLADRKPAQLSGGEQQRVGLARAIAREPDLFLFDEPTAHLDTPLRAALQEELAERRARTGIAAVTATHDVAEALAAADRVVLLRDGRVIQVGTPIEVYEQPADLWAARLTGPASALDATLVGDVAVRVEGSGARGEPGDRVLVRPDWASLRGNLTGTVVGVWFRGPHTDYRLATSYGEVEIREAGPPGASVGATIGWQLHRAWLIPAPGS